MKTAVWNKYFENNKKNVLNVERGASLISLQERKKISASIQSFQLGESSEGLVLKKQAKKYCDQIGNYEYLDSIGHLIREENRHSAYLGKFMDYNQIPRIKKRINDSIFRFLRRLMNVEISARVLVTAEIIALTYYDCLSTATNSTELNKICRLMCDEEKKHIEFQLQHIHFMSFKGHTLIWALSNIGHYFFFMMASMSAWLEHRKVISDKYTFRSFLQKVSRDFKFYNGHAQDVAACLLVEQGFLKSEVLCTSIQ